MAKFKLITTDISYSEFYNLFRERKYDIFLVKGTDAIIYLEQSDPIVFSKKARMGGSSADDQMFNSYMYSKSYDNHYGIYCSSDFKYMMDRLNAVKFNKNAHIEARKVASGFKRYHKIGESAKQRYAEYGVELELESDSIMSSTAKDEMKQVGGKLVYDVGGDPSVKGGTEIRFNHPALSGWKYKEIANLLTFCKSKGAKIDSGTAGMHIHISREGIGDIIEKFKSNLSTMKDILYPINCRKLKLADGRPMYFGVENNIYRDQRSDFGTLEIRAWNATLDPKLFLARIKFCKTFTEWLAKTTTVSVQSFFEYMSAKEKANYKYMLNHKENPHEWGFPPKAINALLAA